MPHGYGAPPSEPLRFAGTKHLVDLLSEEREARRSRQAGLNVPPDCPRPEVHERGLIQKYDPFGLDPNEQVVPGLKGIEQITPRRCYAGGDAGSARVPFA